MIPLEREQSEVSTPQNRIRWATKRENEAGGIRKRESLLRRWGHHRRTSSAEKRAAASKRASTAETDNTAIEEAPNKLEEADETQQHEQVENKRRVFFNLPLPDDVRDEDGNPIEHFARNKIRTAKYTPISFVPKNLFYQFHNVANLYFLFIIILGVS